MDMRVDHAALGIAVGHARRQQLFAGESFVGGFKQCSQHTQFGPSQTQQDRVSVGSAHATDQGVEVHPDAVAFEDASRRLRWPSTAQYSLNARRNLSWVIGFENVIVRPLAQYADFFRDVGRGGEDDDGR